MRWYFSLPTVKGRTVDGHVKRGFQSVLENSACERLRTKAVWVKPFGQSRSLQGFFGVELGLGIEAKGRSGREVGKCGFTSVGGTEGLDVPTARGEETEGREYIMTGIWGYGTSEEVGRGKMKEKLTPGRRRERRSG